MAIAGKVAITLSTENGGAWSADVTYDRLVAVKHNNNLYISRKTVANVEPPNDDFWFLALEGFGGDDVEDIINGTTQVGNAKTLDGHGAEYFAPKTDLANYLPLTGGTIEGRIHLKHANNGYGEVRKANSADYDYGLYLTDRTASGATASLRAYAGGNTAYFVDNDSKNKELLHIGNMASYVLPLTGGKIKNLTIKEGTSQSLLRFELENGTSLGGVGFDPNGTLYTWNGAFNKVYSLLHTGNKPTGTYTGNGDATQRIIETGGTGEFALIKYGNTGFALLTSGGYIGSNGTAVIRGSDAYFASSKIILSTTNVIFNESGSTYKWQVL